MRPHQAPHHPGQTVRVALAPLRDMWGRVDPGAPPRFRDVPVTHAEHGLAIQRSLGKPGWQVVHIRSGRLASRVCRLQREAIALQRALLALPDVEWTWSRSRLQRLKKKTRAHIVAIARGEE